MARINLLPWRDKLRKQRQVQFIAVAATMMAVTALGMVGVHFYHVDRIEYQKKRVAFIDKKIRELDAKILQIKQIDQTRRNLEKRIQKVRNLERNRAEVVHLFHEITEKLPKGIFLTQISQNRDRITLKGIAQDNNDISRYILNLEKSKWINNLGLDVINNRATKDGNAVVSAFVVTAAQVKPKKAKPRRRYVKRKRRPKPRKVAKHGHRRH